MKNKKLVWVVRVISRNFMSDFMANMKNILGGRLGTYEKMLNFSLDETSKDFYDKYPDAEEVRIEFTEFTNGALAIIIHGVINVIK